MMVFTSEFRKGLKVLVDNEPFIIVDFQHVKPGKGGAFVRTRIKSLVSGNVLDRTFRSGDKLDVPEMEDKSMQYMYKEGVNYYFMDVNTYDQILHRRGEPRGREELPERGTGHQCLVLQREGDRRRPAQLRGPCGSEDGAGHEGGHRPERHEACRARVGLHASGPALPRRGRDDQDRHEVGGIHHAGLQVGAPC